MEWIKSIIEKHKKEDGTFDLDAAIKEINKEAPNNVIPKEQYNVVSETKKKLESDLKARDEQLDVLKKSTGDVEELRDQIGKLQDDNKKAKDDYELKLKDMKFDAAIEKALSDAIHPDLIVSKIDRNKLVLNDDGTVIGLDEQKKELQKSYADQFKIDKKGKKPLNPEGAGITITKEQFNKMNYSERTKLFTENKELYDELKGEN